MKPIELLPPDMRYCDLLSTESIPDCAAALICALKARLPAQDPVLQGVTSEILAAIASQRDKGLATYGGPLGNDHPRLRDHLREELADVLVYAFATTTQPDAPEPIRRVGHALLSYTGLLFSALILAEREFE